MEKQFLFIEEGSIEYPHLRKFLDKSGLTDANIINYKKGAPKPELVSIQKDSQGSSEIEIMKETVKACKQLFFEDLQGFLDEYAEKQSYHESNAAMMVDRDVHLLICRGTLDDFMNNFKEYLNKKHE